MSVHAVEPLTTSHLDIRTVERRSYTEYYLTASADDSSATAERQFSEMASVLAERGIQPIQEKVYGRTEARDEIPDVRAREFGKRDLNLDRPFSYVEQPPMCGSDLAGVQLWGIASSARADTSVLTVAHDGHPPARCWEAPGFRMLYLPAVDGAYPDGTLPTCPTGQARQMFENASAALSASGFAYTQVVRTWIYVARLLDWYGEFNRVRTAHHATVGLHNGPHEAIFPASTGIQGKFLDRECVMDLLALDIGDRGCVSALPIRGSCRQPPAFSYGSAFSRGMSVATEGKKTLYVSGTASINAVGESVYVGDPEAQSVETLLNVAALLEQQGGDLEDICLATLFCKTPEAFEAYQTIIKLMHAPVFPTVAVMADVCRSDLLVEMEAVAVI